MLNNCSKNIPGGLSTIGSIPLSLPGSFMTGTPDTVTPVQVTAQGLCPEMKKYIFYMIGLLIIIVATLWTKK